MRPYSVAPRTIIVLLIILLVQASLCLASPLDSPKQLSTVQPLIKVGLWSNQPSIIVSATGDYCIIDAATKKVLSNNERQDKVVVSFDKNQIAINNKPVTAKQIIIDAKEKTTFIEVNRRHYRGNISIYQTNVKSGLTVVNLVPLEEYLYGVVAREISPDWPLEAVKAQAVAARTFALYHLYFDNKHQDDGYDVCATIHCQVYGGIESEATGAIRAVNDTNGQAVLYNGKVIPTFFHSSSGGFTENSENVWGGYYPYLRGVKDYDQQSPHYKWEKSFSPAQIEERLNAKGHQVGHIQAIELSSLSQAPVSATDRGVSGRVKTITVIGDKGSVQLSGNSIRSILDLNSTLFDIKIIKQGYNDIEFAVTDTAGGRDDKKIKIDLPATETRKLFTDKNNVHRINSETNQVVFTGFGWGHGLGLSQWGAKAMAEQVTAGDKAYFKQILQHYYQGVTVQKIY